MFLWKTFIFIWCRGYCDTRMGLLLCQRLQRQPIWGILWIKQRSCREDDEFRDIPASLNNNKTCGWDHYRNPIKNLIFRLIVSKNMWNAGPPGSYQTSDFINIPGNLWIIWQYEYFGFVMKSYELLYTA